MFKPMLLMGLSIMFLCLMMLKTLFYDVEWCWNQCCMAPKSLNEHEYNIHTYIYTHNYIRTTWYWRRLVWKFSLSVVGCFCAGQLRRRRGSVHCMPCMDLWSFMSLEQKKGRKAESAMKCDEMCDASTEKCVMIVMLPARKKVGVVWNQRWILCSLALTLKIQAESNPGRTV